MKKTYDYPVWRTQGNGLVRKVKGKFIFIKKPNCSGLDVSDEMPKCWKFIPDNHLAWAEKIKSVSSMPEFVMGSNEGHEQCLKLSSTSLSRGRKQ